MNLRVVSLFAFMFSFAACATEMEEVGAPVADGATGSGTGGDGGTSASSSSSSSTSSSSSSSGVGGSTSSGSGGSGGDGGSSKAFGGAAGVGGSSGGSGGSSGGDGGTGGSSGGNGGSGGNSGGSGGTPPTGDCADAVVWDPEAVQASWAPLATGDLVTFNDKLFSYAGTMLCWDFNAQCPPETGAGVTRESFCEGQDQYKYTALGPCE